MLKIILLFPNVKGVVLFLKVLLFSPNIGLEFYGSIPVARWPACIAVTSVSFSPSGGSGGATRRNKANRNDCYAC